MAIERQYVIQIAQRDLTSSKLMKAYPTLPRLVFVICLLRKFAYLQLFAKSGVPVSAFRKYRSKTLTDSQVHEVVFSEASLVHNLLEHSLS